MLYPAPITENENGGSAIEVNKQFFDLYICKMFAMIGHIFDADKLRSLGMSKYSIEQFEKTDPFPMMYLYV